MLHLAVYIGPFDDMIRSLLKGSRLSLSSTKHVQERSTLQKEAVMPMRQHVPLHVRRLEDLLVELSLFPNLSTLFSFPTPTSLTYVLLEGEPLGLDLHTVLLSP